MTSTTPRDRAARRWPAALTSAAAIVGAVLAPKCPLCVLALLSACGIGIGMGAAGVVAAVARPAAVVLAIAALAAAIVPRVRRRSRRPPPGGGCGGCGGGAELV